MTIKNSRKNISAENEYIVIEINSNTLTKAKKESNLLEEDSSENKNFTSDLILTVKKENFYDERKVENGDAIDSTKKITIPLKELVRLGHLEANYYNKQNSYSAKEIDAKIKLHYKVLSTSEWNTIKTKTNKQWAEEVRLAEKTNYIFLVPFESPNYEADNDDETIQEGYYIEYFYSVEDNADGTPNLSTEKMEKRGSTRINLTGYLKTSELDSELSNLANDLTTGYGHLVAQVTENTEAIPTKLDKKQSSPNHFVITGNNSIITTKEKIGNIDIQGILYENTSTNKAKNKILTTNNDGIIIPSNNLTTAQIKSSQAISGKTLSVTTANTQHQINSLIDEKLYDIYGTQLPKYLQISNNHNNDISSEVWGKASSINGGLSYKQAHEEENDAKSLKLGDYIYYVLKKEYYTQNDIDSMIQDIISLQANTLDIL